MSTKNKLSNPRNPKGTLSEFAPVLYVFVILILIPLMNIGFFSIGVMGVQLLVSEAARAASSADSRQNALNAMSTKAQLAGTSGLLKVAKAVPVGGFNNSGCTLYCKKIPAVGGNPQIFDLSSAMPVNDRPETANNATDFIYEYTIEGQYRVSPLLDMSGLPIVGNIPGVAGSQVVKFATSNVVENPKALDN
jgi:hypothetical protein